MKKKKKINASLNLFNEPLATSETEKRYYTKRNGSVQIDANEPSIFASHFINL